MARLREPEGAWFAAKSIILEMTNLNKIRQLLRSSANPLLIFNPNNIWVIEWVLTSRSRLKVIAKTPAVRSPG